MADLHPATIRPARPEDGHALAQLRHALWPESSEREHAEELAGLLAGRTPGRLPMRILLAELSGGTIVGFAEAGLRSHAEGCDPSQEVGYLEGWFVREGHRRKGIGAALLRPAEAWSRDQGCKEMASDAGIENESSQRAQEALGFTVAARSVNYRKSL